MPAITTTLKNGGEILEKNFERERTIQQTIKQNLEEVLNFNKEAGALDHGNMISKPVEPLIEPLVEEGIKKAKEMYQKGKEKAEEIYQKVKDKVQKGAEEFKKAVEEAVERGDLLK